MLAGAARTKGASIGEAGYPTSMLKRRGVVARWEPRRGTPADTFTQVMGAKIQELSNDPKALIYADSLAIKVDHLGPSMARARFMSLRDESNSPIQFDPTADLSPITIAPGCYIADAMHLIFALERDGGFVAFDRHRGGPTLGELSEYFNDFLKLPIIFSSLYNRSLASDLEDMKGNLRRIEIGFTATELPDTRRLGFFSSAIPAGWGEKVATYGVTLGVGRSRQAVLPSDMQEAAIQLTADADEILDRMKIWGRRRSTGNVDELNILRRRIGEHLEFKPSTAGPNMPDPSDAYEKIHAMFQRYQHSGALNDALQARAINS